MPTEALNEYCRLGRALAGETVIDLHAHMGPWREFAIPHNSAAGMVVAMDLLGIDCCVCSPHIAIGPGYREGNRQVADAAAEFPGRFIPYITVNPNYPDAEVREEIGFWHARGGIRAFKIHPALHAYKADGPGYAPVYEYASAHSTPILSHSWAGDALGGASLLSRLAGEMPNVAFLVGHSASSWAMIEEACVEAGQRDNVYLDLTGSQLLYLGLETMVARVGAEKIVFGTDAPFIDPAPALGRVLMARVTDDEKRLILGLNARRILGSEA